MHQYIQYADETIKKRQERLIELGISSAAAAILAVYRWAGINGKNYIAKTMMGGSARSALEVMIGLCADGTPLNLYLQRIYGDATIGLTQALIDGIAQGLNPIEVARRMRDGFGMGMNHALNTARTETLRAYRISSLETYRQSGVVKGWKRIASHDGGTCAGCLLTEGEFYEIQDNFDEHNQGRCGLIPVVEGVDEPVWLGGKDWFLQQSDQKQVDILGQGRFDAWKNGVSLDAMVTRVSDPVWGGSFIPTPVDQLNNE
jgi:SPP1 gp7 family putative phage head morphogenesis protein